MLEKQINSKKWALLYAHYLDVAANVTRLLTSGPGGTRLLTSGPGGSTWNLPDLFPATPSAVSLTASVQCLPYHTNNNIIDL